MKKKKGGSSEGELDNWAFEGKEIKTLIKTEELPS